MYEALSEYYEEKGYFVNSPSRTYRYQILLEFAINSISFSGQKQESGSFCRELFQELLTKDFYLRENAKSRPDFSKDLLPYKENIRAFYRREEKERKLLPGYMAYDARQMAKMTHIEVFDYDLQSGKRLQAPQMLLFDYRKRFPLTNQAALQEIVLDA